MRKFFLFFVKESLGAWGEEAWGERVYFSSQTEGGMKGIEAEMEGCCRLP